MALFSKGERLTILSHPSRNSLEKGERLSIITLLQQGEIISLGKEIVWKDYTKGELLTREKYIKREEQSRERNWHKERTQHIKRQRAARIKSKLKQSLPMVKHLSVNRTKRLVVWWISTVVFHIVLEIV